MTTEYATKKKGDAAQFLHMISSHSTHYETLRVLIFITINLIHSTKLFQISQFSNVFFLLCWLKIGG